MNIRKLMILAGASFASMAVAAPAFAQDKYVGELFLVGNNYCPVDSLPANGQILATSTNAALFSLYGTYYGGNGSSTFGIPDLRGRVPLSVGQGTSLSNVTLGQVGGAEAIVQTTAQLAAHNHTATAASTATGYVVASSNSATLNDPAANNFGTYATGSPVYAPSGGTAKNMAPNLTVTVGTTVTVAGNGSSSPMSLRNPFLGLQWCVVTSGLYPSRP